MRQQISLRRIKNRDASWTFYLRYYDYEQDRFITEKSIRTGPHCGVREYRRTFSHARHLAATRIEELRPGGLSGQRITLIKIADARAKYLLWAQSLAADGKTNLGKFTTVHRQRHIDQFLIWLNQYGQEECRAHRIGHIARVHLALWRDFLIGRKLKPQTVNAMLASISSWMQWAVDRGYRKDNPCAGLRRVKCKPKRPGLPIRTPQDLLRLTEQMVENRRGDIILLLACTGLRAAEFANLQVGNFHAENETLVVPEEGAERTKHHGRTIPLCQQAFLAAQRLASETSGPYLAGSDGGAKPYNSQIGRWIKPYGVKPHDLRRFFITALETVQTPKNVIDDLSGHSPGKIRGAYTPQDNLEAAWPWIRKFEQWLAD